ncbi:MAG: hypothetical protein K0S38_794 [Candidatus Paceibacter sp.]|jgi:hypothetical protein|nr:hypothetical protein [Candidatus Paceibacter sp.]
MILERFENSSRLFVWLGMILIIAGVFLVGENILFLSKARARTIGTIQLTVPVRGTFNFVRVKSVILYANTQKPYMLSYPYPLFGRKTQVNMRYDQNDPTKIRVATFSSLWLPSISLFVIGSALLFYSKLRSV